MSAGCRPSPPAQFRFNEVEWIKQERLELGEGEHLAEDNRQQIVALLSELFGTPDAPKFPYLLGAEDPARQQIPINQLKLASGPVVYEAESSGRGLFRQHCAHCHGITGDGAGVQARSLDPYPRDFRLGKFKFKSTPLRRAPTNEDLRRTLNHGIPGSAMPSFHELGSERINALITYVKYLSIRGQYERELIAQTALLDGEPLLKSLPTINSNSDWKTLLSQAASPDAEDELTRVIYEPLYDNSLITRWIDPEQHVSAIPEPPPTYTKGITSDHPMVVRGKVLFSGKANCVQCHGETGMGDGQVDSFDDWTEDWLKTVRTPTDASQIKPFLSAGALPPRKIRPRNLREPLFRGGNRPQDLYLRIANGIEGTPMPSSSILSEVEIWELVAFVLAMANSDNSVPTAPVLNDRISAQTNSQATKPADDQATPK